MHGGRDQHGIGRPGDAYGAPVLGHVPGRGPCRVSPAPALRSPRVVRRLTAQVGVEEVDGARVAVVARGGVARDDRERRHAGAPTQIRGHELQVEHAQLLHVGHEHELLTGRPDDGVEGDRCARVGRARVRQPGHTRQRAPALGGQGQRQQIAVRVGRPDRDAHLLTQVDVDHVRRQRADDGAGEVGDRRLHVEVVVDQIVVRVGIERVRAERQLLAVGEVVLVGVRVRVRRERVGAEGDLVAVAHAVAVPVVCQREHGDRDRRERDRPTSRQQGRGGD